MTRDAINRRKRWAYGLTRKVSAPPPTYGSPAWCELADTDAQKIAACVIAAESWAADGDNLEENLRLEIENLQRAHKRLEDEEYAARQADHKKKWDGRLRVVHSGSAYADTQEFRDGGRAS